MEAASSQLWEPAASRGCKTFARSTKDATSQPGRDLGAQLGLQQCSPQWGLRAWIMVRKKRLWFITSIAGVACKFAVEVGRAGGGLDVRGGLVAALCPLCPSLTLCSVSTGPPGRRGKPGRRGEPGKHRGHPTAVTGLGTNLPVLLPSPLSDRQAPG